MKTFKANETDTKALTIAAANLKAANAQLASAKKQADAAKAAITDWLQNNRQVTLENLEIGEIIQIEGIVMIERNKQNKFDEKAFSLSNPALHEQFKKDFPINKFKPLV